jgi:O-antigen ligase
VPSARRSAVAPLYLFACLILGGSAQGIWANAALQLAGIAIITWAAVSPALAFPKPARLILLLAIAAMLVVVLQDIPLPSSFWAHGSRERIVESYTLLGRSSPPLPISVTPYGSLGCLLSLIPPLAMFCAMVGLNAYRRGWLAAALLAATMLGILLGALQVVSGEAGQRWYLYAQTNLGVAVGFFANANHMATLLIIAIPFVAAVASAARSSNIQRYSALLTILAAAALLLAVGIALNGSLAGYALAAPVIAASTILILPRQNRSRLWRAVAAAVLAIGAIAVMASSSIGADKLGAGANVSIESREQILRTTGRAIADFMPLGSGLGSFAKVYRLYERPETVTGEWVIHAHNDYAELALELGVAGIVLLLLFLAWWSARVWAVWREGEGGPFAVAGSIASAAVLLHSLVDFPLRTAAISACFAMCIALLADRKTPFREEVADLRPTRHLVIR